MDEKETTVFKLFKEWVLPHVKDWDDAFLCIRINGTGYILVHEVPVIMFHSLEDAEDQLQKALAKRAATTQEGK